MVMVQGVSRRWNTLIPSLLQLAEKLEALGLTFVDGQIFLVENERDKK
jgi:hypothetical protein